MSFLGLCYDIDGLWYWPWGDNGLYPGLILGLDTLHQRWTHKFRAVKDEIGPFVNRFGALLHTLDWVAAGRADTVSTGFVSSVQSLNLPDPYVEMAQYQGVGHVADYGLLVNRNTSDTSTVRQLVLELDAAALSSPNSTHYYVIDLNPTYAGLSEDTT